MTEPPAWSGRAGLRLARLAIAGRTVALEIHAYAGAWIWVVIAHDPERRCAEARGHVTAAEGGEDEARRRAEATARAMLGA